MRAPARLAEARVSYADTHMLAYTGAFGRVRRSGLHVLLAVPERALSPLRAVPATRSIDEVNLLTKSTEISTG